jgi:hypothetical protein
MEALIMKMLVEGAVAGLNGSWLALVPPHQVAMLGQPKITRGTTSILLASSPNFDSNTGHLSFEADSVLVLNLGTTPRTFVIDTIVSADVLESRKLKKLEEFEEQSGVGDREFLGLVEKELRGEAQEAAVDLVREIRKRWPGDLKRGERNNFSNTPDNFWYVIVQPRVQSLSITVRGAPDRFKSAVLELRGDRPGYTRFLLKNPDDVPEALRIIEQSKRK